MNEEAYEVFLKGHMPVIGVNMALPIIEIAGEEHWDKLMMPMSMPLAQHRLPFHLNDKTLHA